MRIVSVESLFREPSVARIDLENGSLLLVQYPDELWYDQAVAPLAAVVQLPNQHVVDLPVDCPRVTEAHAMVLEFMEGV